MVTTRSSSLASKTPKSNFTSQEDPKPKPKPNPTSQSKQRYTSTAITPTTLKSISLYDWWLAKPVEGKGLAVGGLASRENLGARMFCSAAIAKRRSATILETMDGITITINGCINRSRTHLNGFQLEVCNHFLIGFPYYWEYATQSYSEDSTNRSSLSGIPNLVGSNMPSGSCSKHHMSSSLDDLPATKLCDILMSPLGVCEHLSPINVTFDDLRSKLGGNASRKSSEPINSSSENKSPDKNTSAIQDETPSNLKNVKGHRGENRFNAVDARGEQFAESSSQSKMGLNVFTSSGGVLTRGGSRLNCGETIENLSGRMVAQTVPNKSRIGQRKEVNEISDMSVVRRSSRMKKMKYLSLDNME